MKKGNGLNKKQICSKLKLSCLGYILKKILFTNACNLSFIFHLYATLSPVSVDKENKQKLINGQLTFVVKSFYNKYQLHQLYYF